MTTATGLYISGNLTETGRHAVNGLTEEGCQYVVVSAGSISATVTAEAVSETDLLFSLDIPVTATSSTAAVLSILYPNAIMLPLTSHISTFAMTDTTKTFVLTEI